MLKDKLKLELQRLLGRAPSTNEVLDAERRVVEE